LIFSPQAPEAIFGTRACIFYCLSLANADDKLKHVGHVVARFLSRLVANVDDKANKACPTFGFVFFQACYLDGKAHEV